MAEKEIEKRSDPQVRRLRLIRDGEIQTHLFCEGLKLVQELLDSRHPVEVFYCLKEREENAQNLLKMSNKQSIPIQVLSQHVMEFVSDLFTPPGFIAVAPRPEQPSQYPDPYPPNPLFLILHQIQLPQNVGTLIRTAEAAGVSEVWTTPNTTDPYGPKALRGSAGSALRVPIRTRMPLHEALTELHAHGINVYGATQDGTIGYHQVPWKKSTALVMGSEGSGFTIEEMKYLKKTVRIPMQGQVESLNVGTAAAVCLFEASRQRRKPIKKTLTQ